MILKDKLFDYAEQGVYPFHMPGHKRNTSLLSFPNPYEIDITEIDGFDNMHNAKDVIRESMERANTLYQSEETLYLINGSTAGILTGICGSTKKGDKILVARNCHKAVYNAIILNELNPVYLYPQYDCIKGIQCGYSAKYIEEMLIKHPDVALIVLVSPTYEGVVSDIEAIANAAHKRNIPLLVDEAHGAHFGFSNRFPKNSIELGADIVIHSVHKTLPAFTQTALMHINGELVDRDRIKHYYSTFQSSSPSYILMSGIDVCIEIVEKQGQELFKKLEEYLDCFYDKMKVLKKLCVIPYGEERDFSKIIISTNNTDMTGPELYDILLEKYKIQMEMVAKDYVLGIATICDTKEGFKRLEDALIEIDMSDKVKICNQNKNATYYESIESNVYMLPYEVLLQKKKKVSLNNACGEVSGDFVYVYPPGIPILAPGEEILNEIIDKIIQYQEAGLEITGLDHNNLIQIIYREDKKCLKYL